MKLEILFEDESLIAVNKPNGLIMHKTQMAKDAKTSLLFELKNQTNNYLYTVHRLDRKTSGVVIFAKKIEVQRALSQLFMRRQVEKEYYALVRGFTPQDMEINYAIKNDKGITKDAMTMLSTLEYFEIDKSSNPKHQTSRYSLVSLSPKTGRYHQLRMHLAHVFHPIIADRPHGCNKQNKFFKNEYHLNNMLLHAHNISFFHPISDVNIHIEAALPLEFERILSLFRKIKIN